jgi:hypothetical protein
MEKAASKGNGLSLQLILACKKRHTVVIIATLSLEKYKPPAPR